MSKSSAPLQDKIDYVCQWAILTLGAAAIASFALDKPFAGFVFTLLGEPFWIYTSVKNKQWGVFYLALWYTGWACYGIVHNV